MGNSIKGAAMSEISRAKHKIPHPWWHWFFTRWIRSRSYDNWDSEYKTVYCSKCDCKWEQKINDIGRCVKVTRIEVDYE